MLHEIMSSVEPVVVSDAVTVLATLIGIFGNATTKLINGR